MQTILHKSGYISADRQRSIERVRTAQRRRVQQELVETFVARCGVWPRFAGANLHDVEYPQSRLSPEDFQKYLHARDQLESLLESPGILILYGGNGPGKTHLASALVYAFCERGMEAKFITATDFFLSIKSTFGEKGRTQEDVIRKYRSYELVAVDEIEVRSDSAWENNLFRDFINASYSMVKSMVILTNKSAEEINGAGGTPYFSNAIRDRILQDGGLVPCTWPSLRPRSTSHEKVQ